MQPFPARISTQRAGNGFIGALEAVFQGMLRTYAVTPATGCCSTGPVMLAMFVAVLVVTA